MKSVVVEGPKGGSYLFYKNDKETRFICANSINTKDIPKKAWELAVIA